MKDIFCPYPRLTKALSGAACLLLCGIAAQAQPTITGVYPSGAYQFQNTNSLSFTVNSAAQVTNITVGLTITKVSTGASTLQTYTLGNGLTVTGPATAEIVSAPLNSNIMYSASISATDANGKSGAATVNFDTIAPSYLMEAEDWDFNGGHSIDNPEVNQYAGLNSISNTDYLNTTPGSGTASYRPQGMETEGAGDAPRLAYIGTTNVDYDVGYANNGGWANYTHVYPKGVYNIYGRLADGNGATTDAEEISIISSAGNSTLQSVNGSPFMFNVKSTGWQNYTTYPLVDAGGSLVQFTNDGSKVTLQMVTVGGNYNANYYFLLPADTNVPQPGATITAGYPDGTTQFQDTNSMNFSVVSGPGVLSSDVTVKLTATSLIGQVSSSILTSGNGLTVSGTPTDFQVSLGLQSNNAYSAFIQTVDESGNSSSLTVNFDTIHPTYTFESEDYDYNGGLFFDNPQTNAYSGLDGVSNIDWYVDDPTSGSHSYRQSTGYGPETESCSDIPRAGYAASGFADYDVGFTDPANWQNYTRHYPPGVYNIYARAANGGGGNGAATLGLVTSGFKTTNQTVQNLGSFVIPATGGWQTYVFAGLKDSSGTLVKVTLTGTNAETFHVSGPSSENGNFFMLVPADTRLPVISGLYPNGTNLLQRSSTLSFNVASSDGINTSGINVSLNGTSIPLTIGGGATNRTVSYAGLQNDTSYNASILITTIGGVTLSNGFAFDTFSPSYYQFESADYDYTSNNVPALFFDNSQEDRYNGLLATPGVDEQEVTSGAPISEDVYRPSPDGSTVLICTQGGGDAPRPQFYTTNGVALSTWRINWFGFGDFCNYTRHYPPGSYNIVGKFTEGGANSSATLYKVTGGVGTTTQTTSLLGAFNIQVNGWNAWEYEWLVDGSGTPVVVTLDGSKTTLQLQGPLVDDTQTINAGFFMLVPATAGSHGPTITATVASGNINISFPTVTGSSYQVQSRASLSSGSWANTGSPISGNNSVQSVQFAPSGGSGFFRVEIQ